MTTIEYEGYEMPNSHVLEQQLAEMRISISKMADALTKLAILEERHQVTQARVEKLEDRLVEVSKQASAVEINQIKHFATIDGILRVLKIQWLVLGTTLTLLVGKILLNYLKLG